MNGHIPNRNKYFSKQRGVTSLTLLCFLKIERNSGCSCFKKKKCITFDWLTISLEYTHLWEWNIAHLDSIQHIKPISKNKRLFVLSEAIIMFNIKEEILIIFIMYATLFFSRTKQYTFVFPYFYINQLDLSNSAHLTLNLSLWANIF